MSELSIVEYNLPVEMFEEVFNHMSITHVIGLSRLNQNARTAANRIIQRYVDNVYHQYSNSLNVLLTKRLNKFWAVQICKSSSDGHSRMFYKINLFLFMRCQISESRFIDMSYPKQDKKL